MLHQHSPIHQPLPLLMPLYVVLKHEFLSLSRYTYCDLLYMSVIATCS